MRFGLFINPNDVIFYYKSYIMYSKQCEEFKKFSLQNIKCETENNPLPIMSFNAITTRILIYMYF